MRGPIVPSRAPDQNSAPGLGVRMAFIVPGNDFFFFFQGKWALGLSERRKLAEERRKQIRSTPWRVAPHNHPGLLVFCPYWPPLSLQEKIKASYGPLAKPSEHIRTVDISHATKKVAKLGSAVSQEPSVARSACETSVVLVSLGGRG